MRAASSPRKTDSEIDRSETPTRPVSPILANLRALHAHYHQDVSGEVATYIPELAKVDPELFGIALATADGEMYEAGDTTQSFTIQAVSKPLVYGLALEDHGRDKVLASFAPGVAFGELALFQNERRTADVVPVSGARC